ncbi:MAG TPA: hypothetical protein VM845_14115 [Burkholderiaceae bacterium]|jgi:hypothetical protein|nr:hypothetical protein [Burkholderiaceae bacterium]
MNTSAPPAAEKTSDFASLPLPPATLDNPTYVAVERGVAKEMQRKLSGAKVKGRSVKDCLLEG